MQNAQDKNIVQYNEYIAYLLKQKEIGFDLMKLLEQNSKLILICSNETVKQINNLVITVNDKKTTENSVVNVIVAVRSD